MKSLKKLADKYFSLYIRQKHSDINGDCVCFTCNTKKNYKKMQCGHYESRKFSNTRYLESNVAPQCVGCNLFQSQLIKPIFAINLINREGKNILKKLRILAETSKGFTEEELKKIINKYKKLIK